MHRVPCTVYRVPCTNAELGFRVPHLEVVAHAVLPTGVAALVYLGLDGSDGVAVEVGGELGEERGEPERAKGEWNEMK